MIYSSGRMRRKALRKLDCTISSVDGQRAILRTLVHTAHDRADLVIKIENLSSCFILNYVILVSSEEDCIARIRKKMYVYTYITAWSFQMARGNNIIVLFVLH